MKDTAQRSAMFASDGDQPGVIDGEYLSARWAGA